ncbi:MAG: hypothetical protein ACD_38C00151G0004 [uncultured bacterium]|uniref:Oxidoreductase FAD/NAD(P)-binding family protein n=1 Tax=Candidatus Daviesbacteria bacterium GW2011_GWC2_40_12 TaxID=1618431 RepID=A0A0G0T5I0_9BACT|nr:MAG: hypothetical protein ACD_38C00151G0004 [uncultured bacterium]KKQ82753.1 MAG: Oxidoreductase FAD/NAD(P)-binding family protein [Candidatus Daviesbacteria bacterium GW2011_GWF2_38_7]KKR16828.1 MAG: Oxidoreductase FAD/NAD(P)-binding family protein [Candidatus Daviesbacteria bacterium GW2011_GWA2_39_33]KKR24459.1 MAG: Oxidoreductase FAD/NAD(P)-binding family protein [Candidatus Daviesbacteria bacterium GW2011_GWB1_39_5]KKR42390.1 MAG: Oxidoreductase FAD/NAD(P)-binding family protein [Candid
MDKDSLMRIGDKVLSKIPLLKKKAKIVAKKEVAKETLLVKFKVAEGEVNFNPGQFVFVELPKLLYPDENGNRHHFTILNSPNEKGIISITTRIRDTGFKRTLRELPEGTEVEVGPIAGFFTLPNDVSRPLVFIALGIGITPYISMLRYIEEEGLKHKVTLIYSDSDEESLSYLDELKKMEKKNKNFKLVVTITGKKKSGHENRHVNADFIKDYIDNPNKCTFFVSGPPNAVESVSKSLKDAGIENVNTENFSGY